MYINISIPPFYIKTSRNNIHSLHITYKTYLHLILHPISQILLGQIV